MKIYANKNRYLDLEYFKGKELWVKVFNVETISFQYVRILSIGGNYAQYNRINSDAIDGNDLVLREHFDWVTSILTKKFLTKADMLLIAEPIELLTTDEFVDLVKEKQVYP